MKYKVLIILLIISSYKNGQKLYSQNKILDKISYLINTDYNEYFESQKANYVDSGIIKLYRFSDSTLNKTTNEFIYNKDSLISISYLYNTNLYSRDYYRKLGKSVLFKIGVREYIINNKKYEIYLYENMYTHFESRIVCFFSPQIGNVIWNEYNDVRNRMEIGKYLNNEKNVLWKTLQKKIKKDRSITHNKPQEIILRNYYLSNIFTLRDMIDSLFNNQNINKSFFSKLILSSHKQTLPIYSNFIYKSLNTIEKRVKGNLFFINRYDPKNKNFDGFMKNRNTIYYFKFTGEGNSGFIYKEIDENIKKNNIEVLDLLKGKNTSKFIKLEDFVKDQDKYKVEGTYLSFKKLEYKGIKYKNIKTQFYIK